MLFVCFRTLGNIMKPTARGGSVQTEILFGLWPMVPVIAA